MALANGLTPSKELQESSAYTALGEFLSDKSSLEQTVEKFCEPVERSTASAASGDVEEIISTSWRALIAQAAATPFTDYRHGILAEIILALQARETNGDTVMVQQQKLWSDLPLLGWQMREAWNFAAEERSPQKEKVQWLNINAFTAKLVVLAHELSNNRPDYSLYAIWTIRQGLEEGHLQDTAVSAAAVWFIYAASILKEFSQQNKSFEGAMAKGGFSYQNESWRGFTEERWQIWLQKLDAFASQTSNEQAKALVDAARASIKQT